MTNCGFCGSIGMIFCWDLERYLTGVDFDDMKVNNVLMLLNFLGDIVAYKTGWRLSLINSWETKKEFHTKQVPGEYKIREAGSGLATDWWAHLPSDSPWRATPILPRSRSFIIWSVMTARSEWPLRHSLFVRPLIAALTAVSDRTGASIPLMVWAWLTALRFAPIVSALDPCSESKYIGELHTNIVSVVSMSKM